MSLLNRIAQSDGNPQRSSVALRLINERLACEMARCPPHASANPGWKGSGLLAGYSPSKRTVFSCSAWRRHGDDSQLDRDHGCDVTLTRPRVKRTCVA